MKTLSITLLAIASMLTVACRQKTASPLESKSQETHEDATSTQFVFVRIPESIMPLQRGELYEDPLNEILQREAIGEVTGGGSSLSHPDENGKRSIEWVGIDVDLFDFDKGLPVLRAELLKLGAPHSTILEYTRNGEDYEVSLEHENG